MRSATLPSFWKAYHSLEKQVQASAHKAYELWRDDPFHPSLHFKCINREVNIWSVRVTRGYRAIGVLDGETITWFWIGGHDAYDRFFR
jgi:hypothetical protein